MNDNQLVEKFENCTLSGADFNHRNHIRLAWIYLHEYELLDALPKFSENLKKFAASLGAANLYHETITFAYFLLINERIRQSEKASQTWEDFVAANADLFIRKNGILAKYYKSETLASDFSKKVFVLPDKIRDSEYVDQTDFVLNLNN